MYYPLYIALRSVFETYLLRNGWTDLNIYLLTLSWSGKGFRQKKIEFVTGFSRKQEKFKFTLSILADFSAFNFV